MNSVSLENPSNSPSSKGYQIKINCKLDSYSRQSIIPILDKHNLSMNESDSFVTIQSL
jgi:hypothetical protein